MSKLRQAFLSTIRTIGNHSGCHQIPERSFFYHGKQFPVCARCTGVFAGHLTAIVLLCFKRILPVRISCLFLGIMGIDWGLQAINLYPSANPRRLITGFLGGFGLYCLYFTAISHTIRYLRSSHS